MSRYVSFVLFILLYLSADAQRTIASREAVSLALNNQRNLKAANLGVLQQQQLSGSAADFQNPQAFIEATPYEPLTFGVQQTFSLPGVYKSRQALQGERVRLAQLQLLGSQYELNRIVQSNYLQLQYLTAAEKLFAYQDSIYQAIKTSSKRFFDAGQINKLEELQATSQADKVRNELARIQADLAAETQIFRFYTNVSDSFLVEPLQTSLFAPVGDTLVSNVQQQILQQQIAVGQQQLRVEKSELLPQLQAGVSFPTTTPYERFVGYQVGVTIPIWRKQNKSRIAAAQTSIEIAKAQQELELLKINAQYKQAVATYQREQRSLTYFNTTALPQARAIIETSQRLFQGGQLNYIESLRNLQTAFDIFFAHVDTQRGYNEAIIQLNYLKGTL